MFQRETCISVKPIAVGTGAALEMARRGDADAVLVHAPEAEKAYVQSGDLIDGRLIMHNDFLIIGPRADPARVRGEKNAALAMKAIAAAGAFVSRGDGSGTEKKELALWKEAGVSPARLPRREETGQGMGATLLVAEQRQTYTLTDRGTYLAFKDKLTLVPLVEGDPELRNIYHAYVVNPGTHPTAKRTEASRFVRFLVEPKTQEWIGQFGREKYGQPLFVPDAGVDADMKSESVSPLLTGNAELYRIIFRSLAISGAASLLAMMVGIPLGTLGPRQISRTHRAARAR